MYIITVKYIVTGLPYIGISSKFAQPWNKFVFIDECTLVTWLS